MTQVHNAQPEKKAEIRARLVTALGGAANCRVIETHSGPGVMRRLVYAGAADWLGIDKDPASPDAIHCENTLALRAIDLQRFNLFDVDAFGSPWECVWIVSRRRKIAKGELIGLAMTSGQQGGQIAISRNVRTAGWSQQMYDAIRPSRDAQHSLFCGRAGVEVSQRFVITWFPGCKVERWISGRSAKGVLYFGALLRGV